MSGIMSIFFLVIFSSSRITCARSAATYVIDILTPLSNISYERPNDMMLCTGRLYSSIDT
jgi:hypothetical protein